MNNLYGFKPLWQKSHAINHLWLPRFRVRIPLSPPIPCFVHSRGVLAASPAFCTQLASVPPATQPLDFAKASVAVPEPPPAPALESKALGRSATALGVRFAYAVGRPELIVTAGPAARMLLVRLFSLSAMGAGECASHALLRPLNGVYGNGIAIGAPRSYVRPDVIEQLNVTGVSSWIKSPLAFSASI